MTPSERAARDWFGYGSWTAPYWFVGMEPGGEGDGASHASWERLGGGELIDCRAHHLDCDFTRWHGLDRPPTQPTWRRLIQLLLSYKGESTDLDAVARYQRDRLGASGSETAIIELSAHHAVNMGVNVARGQHRDERIETIRQRSMIIRRRLSSSTAARTRSTTSASSASRSARPEPRGEDGRCAFLHHIRSRNQDRLQNSGRRSVEPCGPPSRRDRDLR